MEPLLESTTVFESLHPNTVSEFFVKNSLEKNHWLHTENLRVFILDSIADLHPPTVGVLVLSKGREHDPFTASKTGLKQLMGMFFNISRVFVVSKSFDKLDFNFHLSNIIESDQKIVEDGVLGLLKGFHPKGCDVLKTKFVTLSDGLVFRKQFSMGSYNSASFLITDDKIKVDDSFEYRRRLRFLKTGNYVHTEIRLVEEAVQKEEFLLDKGFNFDLLTMLDSSYMVCWVAVKMLNAERHKKQRGLLHLGKPKKMRLLCFGGIGAACFFNKLKSELGVELVCVDASILDLQNLMELVGMGKKSLVAYQINPVDLLDRWFYAPNEETANHNLEKFYKNYQEGFDLLLVDVKDFTNELYTSPPDVFLKAESLQKFKRILCREGVMLMHFVPSDYFTFSALVAELEKVGFPKVIKIKVSERSFIILAAAAAPEDDVVMSAVSKAISNIPIVV